MEVTEVAGRGSGEDLPPRFSSLADPSEQEALELDVHIQQFYPPTTTTSVNESNKLSRAWRRHVSMVVPHVKCRDHLGKALRMTV
jgi:hypothetical protein